MGNVVHLMNMHLLGMEQQSGERPVYGAGGPGCLPEGLIRGTEAEVEKERR